jgi:thioesterase domain-containing protein
MAQQLIKAGSTIGGLFILDTGAPTGKKQPIDRLDIMLLYEHRFLEEFGVEPTLTKEQLLPLHEDEQLARFKQSLEDTGYFPPNSPIEQIRGIVNVMEADLKAIDYVPADFVSVPIHLFVAMGDERDDEATQAMMDGWSNYGEVTVHEVPGTHYTMMYPPHVAVLTEKLKAAIASQFWSEQSARHGIPPSA